MKFSPPRLTTCVAIAAITCLLSTSVVNAAVADTAAIANTEAIAGSPDQGFESSTNKGKKTHHHHSNKKKHHD
ncbi:hypothetical protein BGZ94_003272, partial [Podila epigama]